MTTSISSSSHWWGVNLYSFISAVVGLITGLASPSLLSHDERLLVYLRHRLCIKIVQLHWRNGRLLVQLHCRLSIKIVQFCWYNGTLLVYIVILWGYCLISAAVVLYFRTYSKVKYVQLVTDQYVDQEFMLIRVRVFETVSPFKIIYLNPLHTYFLFSKNVQ